MSKKMKILIVVAAVLFVSVLGMYLYARFDSDPAPDKSTYANYFVEDISTGSIDSAYILLSDQLEEEYYIQDLESDVQSLGLDESCKLVDIDDSEQDVLTGKIQCESKTFENVRFEFNEELDITSFTIE
jgi:hypothetical protein